ncbi:hypothetical protein A2U01_0062213, partial [Trifolium medium]|nr:hypothetical protein [Trifolium medium]
MGGGDVGECQVLLHSVLLRAHSSDRWKWHLDPVRGYSVR